MHKNYVFVYGTLRKGFGNHWFLENSKFVGYGKTKGKYSLYADGIPYVVKEPLTQIKGEIYGEKVIAAGHIVMSTNVKSRDAILQGDLYHYMFCKECLHFKKSRDEVNYSNCPSCGGSLLHFGKYFRPLGFETKSLIELLNIPTSSKDIKSTIKNKLNRRVANEVFSLSSDSQDFSPIGRMSRDIKPINFSKVRTFFESEGQSFKKENVVGDMRITPYKRGTFVVMNISEYREIDIETGMSLGMYNEKLERQVRKNKENANLGYSFYTDILKVELPVVKLNSLIESNKKIDKFTIYSSLLYAVLEGASESLDIKREDIDGILKHKNVGGIHGFDLILYDDVPAGAGFVESIYNNFKDVIKNAFEIVRGCKCPEDTSCPACLMSPGNQIFASKLRRDVDIEALKS